MCIIHSQMFHMKHFVALTFLIRSDSFAIFGADSRSPPFREDYDIPKDAGLDQETSIPIFGNRMIGSQLAIPFGIPFALATSILPMASSWEAAHTIISMAFLCNTAKRIMIRLQCPSNSQPSEGPHHTAEFCIACNIDEADEL
jgi:hypothetical protein